jgi:hypothetical protein
MTARTSRARTGCTSRWFAGAPLLWLLVGCGNPGGKLTTPAVPPSVMSEARGGPFLLTIIADAAQRAGAPIHVHATATYDGGQARAEAFSPGSGPLQFWLRQIGGDISVIGGGPADCVSKPIARGEIARSAYVKAGGYEPRGPNAAFYERFFGEPQLLLPAGLWEIGVTLNISLEGCALAADTARASVEVLVSP